MGVNELPTNLEICASRYVMLVMLNMEFNREGSDKESVQRVINQLLTLSPEEVEVLNVVIGAKAKVDSEHLGPPDSDE